MFNQLLWLVILNCFTSFRVERISKTETGEIAEPSSSIAKQELRNAEENQIDLVSNYDTNLHIDFRTFFNESADISCYSDHSLKCLENPNVVYYPVEKLEQCQSLCSLQAKCKGLKYLDDSKQCLLYFSSNLVSCTKDDKAKIQLKENCPAHQCQGNTVHAAICASVLPPFETVYGNSILESYIWQPTFARSDMLGTALFSISCSDATHVMLHLETIAPMGNQDSFYIIINGGDRFAWGVPQSSTWQWNVVPKALALSTGTNSLVVMKREMGTKFRTVKIIQHEGTPCSFIPNEPSTPKFCDT
jgi:hypothetical protein